MSGVEIKLFSGPTALEFYEIVLYYPISTFHTRCCVLGHELRNVENVQNYFIKFQRDKMGIDFYYTPGSAPCRSVLLTAKALNLDLNKKILNLKDGEHMTPEFLKINPQHCVPTLVDDGFSIWESRAICTYLVNKYGKGSALYPEEPKARALVDQRLYFDIGTLYSRFGDYLIFAKAPADPAKFEKMAEAVGLLDKFLEGQNYVAGKSITIADLCIVASISSFEAIDFDFKKYPNVNNWYKRIQTSAIGYEEANGEGVKAFKEFVNFLKG